MSPFNGDEGTYLLLVEGGLAACGEAVVVTCGGGGGVKGCD